MKKIITISRQFSSGGREVGKRLADALHYAYVDKEIISKLIEERESDEDFQEAFSNFVLQNQYSISIGHSFMALPAQFPSMQRYEQEHKVLHEIAKKDEPCVIVGRCADYVLEEYKPFRIYIYCSDIDKRIQRCFDKKELDEDLSDKAVRKEIKRIDKERKHYYNYFTDNTWGDVNNYDLCINIANIDIKKAVEIILKALD